jgi:multidrug efflux pump subunit AcrB
MMRRLFSTLGQIPSLRDLQIDQSMEYPSIKVKVDREKAGLLGLSVKSIAEAFVPATSTSRYIYKNLWPDPRSGVTYFVEVEVPDSRMDSIEEVKNIPIPKGAKQGALLRDVAEVREGTIRGEFDRYNLQRTLSLKANIAGLDLGRVAQAVRKAVADAGTPPRGVTVIVRGQVSTLEQIFSGLGSGLVVTVVVIFLLLAANFQSWKLAFVVVSTVPAVLAGVVLLLLGTRTTLNIQSFMGAIMSVGVAVANSILLVTFAERSRKEGKAAREAALEGGRSRLRPIVMTSLSMVAGMIPMALGLSEGGSQAAPLGRAVIGGLTVATVATLFVLPSIYSLAQGNSPAASPSLDPGDPASLRYSPPGPSNPRKPEGDR